MIRLIRSLAPALLLLLLPACGDTDDPGPPIDRDLADIRQIDTLHALVAYDATSYFLYRGQPMGLEYELVREFAAEHDLELRAIIARDRDRVLHRLNDGDGDVAAARMIPRLHDSAHVAFTEPLYQTRPILVQRTEPAESADLPAPADTVLDRVGPLPGDAEATPGASTPGQALPLNARLVRRPAQLADEEVHVPGRTYFGQRLVELADSLGEEIHVVEVDSAGHEALIRAVAAGSIRFTVSPENVARLKEGIYTNIAVVPALGTSRDVTLAVRRNAPELLQALDTFIQEAHASGRIDALYQKYFLDRAAITERTRSDYLTSETGRFSEYDDLLRRHAPAIGWDWRLLASQTYQESRFQPRARSWAGAMGLLQLMPATAREVDVANPYDPEENVAGAVRYLEWLSGQWEDQIADPQQRLRFILASYNAGFGHVSDARRLAEKHGDDPDVWDDVAYWLLQKSKKSVYTDPVVRYGFCRGLEPVTYVALILERYAHYQEFVEA